MHNKIVGCFGTAFGDALAADTKFLSVQAILSRYPNGPQDLQAIQPLSPMIHRWP